MARAMSSRLRSNIRTIAATGVVLALPAAIGIPAHAAPTSDYALSAPAVLSAPPPLDPPPPPPPPPAPAQRSQGEYYNPNDQDDWWVYSGTGSY
jgi:hypothetical protein